MFLRLTLPDQMQLLTGAVNRPMAGVGTAARRIEQTFYRVMPARRSPAERVRVAWRLSGIGCAVAQWLRGALQWIKTHQRSLGQ